MKRLTSIILAVILIMAMPLIAANAAEKPEFLLNATEETNDDIIVSQLSIKDNPGLTALSVQISYSDNLELLSVNDAGLFRDKISTGMLSSNPITISWYSSNCEDCSESGNLAVLRFRIKDKAKAGNISLTYDDDNVFDSNFRNKYLDVSNAAINIEPASVKTESFILGDVDLDNVVTIIDATCIQRYLVDIQISNPESIEIRGDIDGDGLNIIDATLIQRFLVNIRVNYPINKYINRST